MLTILTVLSGRANNSLVKILVVSQYFWPESFRVNELVVDLISRGHQVSVLTGIPNYPSGKIFPDYINNKHLYDTFHGARVFRSPMLPRGSSPVRLILNYISFALCASVYGVFRLHVNTYDLVFVYQLSPITLVLPGILISRLRGLPLVLWVQDLWPDTLVSLNILKSSFSVSFARILVSFIYKQATLILVQSMSFASKISEYVNDSSRIHYLPNWSDGFPVLSQTSHPPELPIVSGVFTVLFAGNIGDAQDFPAILNAAQILSTNSRIRWVIVGSGSRYNWVKSQVISRGLSHCFFLLGRFPYERMPSFFKSADALLISLSKKPAFSLTIPSKLQTYLVSGVPLLGMLDGEGASIITNANAGLVCGAGDSLGLSKLVLQLSNMPLKLRLQMGSNGISYARQEFGKSALLDRLENLLCSLV